MIFIHNGKLQWDRGGDLKDMVYGVNFIMDKDQSQEGINGNVMGRKPHISCCGQIRQGIQKVMDRLMLHRLNCFFTIESS